MKTKALFLVLFLFAFSVIADPVVIKVLQVVTSAGTSEVEVELDVVRPSASASSTQVIGVTVLSTNSGTIQFSVGEAITSDHYAWPAGSKFWVTIKNGKSNLRYKASAASQSFVVTQ